MKKKFIAVVVTYFPRKDFIKNITRIIEFYDKCIIVDNTESEQPCESIFSLGNVSGNDKLFLIRNKKNLGIATALNQGCSKAIEFGADWITTFDQDSYLIESIEHNVKSYLSKYRANAVKDIFGCMYIDPSSAHEIRKEKNGTIGYFEVDDIISSGMSFSSELFMSVSGFDDSFFIDHVDNDFCAKVRLNNGRVYCSSKPLIIHSLGDQARCLFFNRYVVTTNYAPIRNYYQVRNLAFFIIRYNKNFPRLCRRYFSICMRNHFKILLYESNKLIKFKHSFIGIYHALIGKSGKYEG